MLCEEVELPKVYWDKKVTRMSGATGPGFIISFKYSFDTPISIEDALQFHAHRIGFIKGLSLYLADENIWLVFVYRKFHSFDLDEPKPTTEIAGNVVRLSMDLTKNRMS